MSDLNINDKLKLSEVKIKELKRKHLFNVLTTTTGKIKQIREDGCLVDFNGISIFLQEGDFKKIS